MDYLQNVSGRGGRRHYGKKMRPSICCCVLLASLCSLSGILADEPKTLLSDDLTQARDTPLDVGSFPHECFGNVNLCPNGFSLFFNYVPGPGDVKLQHHYIISSGAQSHVSEGIYFRRNFGYEFEAAVAAGDKLWTSTFYLEEDYPAAILLAWNGHTLDAYVDGIPVTSQTLQAQRIFSDAGIDLFPQLVIGRANDDIRVGVSYPKVKIADLVIWDRYYARAQVGGILKNVFDASSLYIGCEKDLPNGAFTTADLSNTISVPACRAYCGSSAKSIALVAIKSTCNCIPLAKVADMVKAHMAGGNTDTSKCHFDVYWATHAREQVIREFMVTVQVKTATHKGYIRSGETVTFVLSHSSTEQVTFHVDYNDGSPVEMTRGLKTSHSWAADGEYKVEITAQTRTTSVTVFKDIVINTVEEGIAPEALYLKADPRLLATDIGLLDYHVDEFSTKTTACTLDFGTPDSMNTYPDLLGVFAAHGTHRYGNIGLFNISYECTNTFGQNKIMEMGLSANPVTQMENKARHLDISIPFLGAQTHSDSLLVMINDKDHTAGVVRDAEAISIGEAVFSYSGEHVVQLQSGSKTLFTKIFNLQEEISRVEIESDNIHLQVHQTIEVGFRIDKGDFVHATINYGDGQTERLFIPSIEESITVKRQVSYVELGQYYLEITVANDVSTKVSKQIISVERPLEEVSLKANHVIKLGEPTIFSIEVDMDAPSAMPVKVHFDYADGTEETVTLGAKQASPKVLVHSHVYEDYGMYFVKAQVKNNISSHARALMVQVGENLTLVDLDVKTEKVVEGDEAEFTVRVPRGWPIVVEMDMGDGKSVVVTRGLKEPVSAPQLTDDSLVNTEQESQQATRKKRSASAPNDLFIVKCSYKAFGRYTVSVRVHNVFSEVRSHLCPDMIVAKANVRDRQCSKIEVAIMDATTEANPVQWMRSKVINLPTSFTLTCPDDVGATFVSSYTWRAARHNVYGEWRPELEVCASEQLSSSLTIPPNTLWYGTYKLTLTMQVRYEETISSRRRRSVESVTVALEGEAADDTGSVAKVNEDKSLPTLLQSESVSTYLEITPTPIVAIIKGLEKNDFYMFDVITVGMGDSFDPDVTESKNKTGMDFYMFCYMKGSKKIMAKRSLDQMLDRSSKIANNSRDTAGIYDTQGCFRDTSRVWVLGQEITLYGEHLSMNDSLVFDLFVTKDSREARTMQEFRVWTTNISGNALDALDALLASGDVSAALFVMDMIMDDMDNVAGESNSSNAEEEVRTKLINALDNVSQNIKNMDQLGKTANVMAKVTDATDKVTEDAKAKAAGALGNTADKAKELAGDSSLNEVTGIADSMVQGVGNVLPFDDNDDSLAGAANNATAQAEARRKRKRKPKFRTPGDICASAVPDDGLTCCQRLEGMCEWLEPKPDRDDVELDDLDWKWREWSEQTCDEIHPDDITYISLRYELWLDEQKLKAFAKRKEATEGGMKATTGISKVMTGKQDSGSAINLNSPRMNLTVVKMNSDDPDEVNRTLSEQGLGNIKLPKSAMGSGQTGAMIMKSKNPFTYSDTGESVTGQVLTLELSSASGEAKEVVDNPEPIELWLDGSPDVVPTLTRFVYTQKPDEMVFNYHRTLLDQNDSSLHVVIIPESEYDSYFVYLKYDGFPNATYFDEMGEVPASDQFIDSIPVEFDNVTREMLKYTWFPSMNATRRAGNYSIGVRLRGSKIAFEQMKQVTNYTYNMQYLISGCRFFNRSIDVWEARGCEVGGMTNIYRTQCLCNHLTSFGSDMVVPPNTIDFNTVFTAEKFIEAIPVFVTVALVLLIYILGLVWARHMDKKDVLKWGATPLEDNLPSDEYHYQLTTHTGVSKTCGTSSKVSFILSGDDGDSGVRRLYDGKRKELPSGSIYNYILSTENGLGPLTYLRIWHDNSGNGKKRSWYLNQVQITDLQTGDRFFFICDRWLAVEEDDGMVERILPVAGMADMTSFKHLFNSSVRKKLTNDHLWVSVLSRPTRSNFTRVQRISCCISLLFLTMITNCMFFQTEDNQENVSAVTIGPISFTLHQLFISVVTTAIVFPPNLFIVTVFRKARGKKNSVMQTNQSLSQKSKKFRWRTFNAGSSLWKNVEKTRMQKFKENARNILRFHQKSKYETGEPELTGKKKKKGWSLPHWTMYIAWFLCFISITGSGFFTVLYSMEWGREKSIEWLTTFVLSFFESVVVVQPVKVLLLAAFISCILRKPDIDEEEDYDDNNAAPGRDEEMLTNSQKDLQEVIRMRKLGASELPPPDTESLAKARDLRMKEMQMEAVLKECIIYFVFLVILFFISYQARDSDSFLFAENIKNTFINTSPAFGSISKPQDFWPWAYATLLPNLYSGVWYDQKTALDWRGSLQIDDRATIRVGVARIRQQRIKEDSCDVLRYFKHLIHHCRDQYGWTDDDTKDYLPGWVHPPDENDTVAYLNDKSSWVYRNSIKLKNAPYAGTISMYKGGGFTLDFKRNKFHTKRLFEELEKMEWLDVRTRSLFVEFTLYNANVNLFGSVVMLVEYMATGAAITRTEVKVFRLSSYIGGFAVIVIIFELLFVCFTIYFLMKMINDLRKQKLKYFKDFWNLLEFSTLVLSITSIAMYALKKVFGEVAMRALHTCGGHVPSGEYVNFITISVWDEVFTYILSFVVFLATIKFVKMLKFNRRMSMLGDTIALASHDLKMFCIVFFLYFAAFAQAAYLLFGKMLASYGSIVGSVEALFSFALGSFDFYEFQDVDRILGPAFFFMYVAVVYIGLMGMFLTIIYDAFAQVKANVELRSNDYEIVDFIWGKFRGVFGWS